MARFDDCEIIAHRGYSARAPENTLAAIEAALAAGADAVEWDVHVASCGTPVLFHDTHLGRTTNGVGPLRRRTLSQLKSLDAGAWFSAEFAGERIPSLQEALERVRGRAQRAYCEVKGYRELEDLDRIVSITRAAGMLQATVFISLDWRTLDRISGQDPAARVGYIVDRADRFQEALGKALAREGAILDFDHRLAAAWTVNDPGEAGELLEAGITRFTTDEVEALLRWREAVRAALSPETPTAD